jgi:hypothetical protein
MSGRLIKARFLACLTASAQDRIPDRVGARVASECSDFADSAREIAFPGEFDNEVSARSANVDTNFQ